MIEIKGELLYAVLMRCWPWHPCATVWRKLPNGKIVRFVNWRWKRRLP